MGVTGPDRVARLFVGLAATQPVVSDRLGRGDAVVGVHLEAAAQKVDQPGVVGGLGSTGVDQCGDQVAGQRWTAEPSSLGVAAGDDGDAVVVERLDAVARHAATRHEVALALTRRHELLARQTEHLDYTRHLVVLVLAREQRVAGQQLRHDAACSQQPRLD